VDDADDVDDADAVSLRGLCFAPEFGPADTASGLPSLVVVDGGGGDRVARIVLLTAGGTLRELDAGAELGAPFAVSAFPGRKLIFSDLQAHRVRLWDFDIATTTTNLATSDYAGCGRPGVAGGHALEAYLSQPVALSVYGSSTLVACFGGICGAVTLVTPTADYTHGFRATQEAFGVMNRHARNDGYYAPGGDAERIEGATFKGARVQLVLLCDGMEAITIDRGDAHGRSAASANGSCASPPAAVVRGYRMASNSLNATRADFARTDPALAAAPDACPTAAVINERDLEASFSRSGTGIGVQASIPAEYARGRAYGVKQSFRRGTDLGFEPNLGESGYYEPAHCRIRATRTGGRDSRHLRLSARRLSRHGWPAQPTRVRSAPRDCRLRRGSIAPAHRRRWRPAWHGASVGAGAKPLAELPGPRDNGGYS
jgi:hypothetical protein